MSTILKLGQTEYDHTSRAKAIIWIFKEGDELLVTVEGKRRSWTSVFGQPPRCS